VKKTHLIGTFILCAFIGSQDIAVAQKQLGASATSPAPQFRDTSVFKPPSGIPVAVIEWEDLECPACAQAFPIIHKAVASTAVPLIERDLLISDHVWSAAAARYARYLYDKVSPNLSVQYRGEVFVSQSNVVSREDLEKFTQTFFRRANIALPSVLDPDGQIQKEIDSDIALAKQIGIRHTPTIIVVTQNHWIQVLDPALINEAIAEAKREAEHK